MDFLNTIFVIGCLLQLSSTAVIRSLRPYQSSRLMYTQEILNPEVAYSYGDTLNFNYPDFPAPSQNLVVKPVDEAQEYVPPQSVGAASVPLLPPPAVPVNAAAANVPSVNGAVYLGSGSIGVVMLGNGAYALGSGGLGYSDGRRQPRPSISAPVIPPLPPSPNLIPAAVPSDVPATPQVQPRFQGFEYSYPVSNHLQDPNAYEVLTADRAGFGTPVVRPPRPLRMHFALPTAPVQAPAPRYSISLSPAIPSEPLNEQYLISQH